MTDKQPDSQAPREQAGAGLPAPAASSVASLPVPQKADPSQEKPISPADAVLSADVEARTEFIGSVHEYVREYIALADQKATFVFAGATALLAFLYTSGVSDRWLKLPQTWGILDLVALVAMVGLAIGAFLALLVVIPRTPGSRRGFIFWEAVARHKSGRDYADELSTLSPASLFQIKAEHTFDLAGVCRRKYRMLRWSLWIGAVGLGASLIVFLFLAAPGPQTSQTTAPASASGSAR